MCDVCSARECVIYAVCVVYMQYIYAVYVYCVFVFGICVMCLWCIGIEHVLCMCVYAV